jgi:hypothetical protein
MSNDEIRQQIAGFQAQADALSPQAQCGTFRLGDNLAAYRSCVQQAVVSTMAQSQQLRLRIAALEGELMQRSLGNYSKALDWHGRPPADAETLGSGQRQSRSSAPISVRS